MFPIPKTCSQIDAPGFQIGPPNLRTDVCLSEWAPTRRFVAHILGGVVRSALIKSNQFTSIEDSSDLYAQTPDRPPLAAVTRNDNNNDNNGTTRIIRRTNGAGRVRP